MDCRQEAILSSDKVVAYIKPSHGGSAVEIDCLPVGANMAVKKSVLAHVGPFDLRRGHRDGNAFGAEESEWLFRAMVAGCRFDYCPGAWVLHPMEALRSRKAMRRRAFAQGRGAAGMAAVIAGKGLPLQKLFRGPSGGREAGKNAFFHELRLLLAMGMAWEMMKPDYAQKI